MRGANFDAYYVPDRAQALVKVLELIRPDCQSGSAGP